VFFRKKSKDSSAISKDIKELTRMMKESLENGKPEVVQVHSMDPDQEMRLVRLERWIEEMKSLYVAYNQKKQPRTTKWGREHAGQIVKIEEKLYSN
jgi:phosphoribosylanthranilate isomerase